MSKWKGTFEIELGGEKYQLRPSFDALCEFEEAAHVPAHVARQQLIEGNFGAKVIPAALWAGIKGEHLMSGQKCPSFRVVGETVRKAGMFGFQVEALKFLTYGLSADDIIERIENDEPEEEKKS